MPATFRISPLPRGPFRLATLGDGTRLYLKPIGPADRQAIADGLARLSPAARFERFRRPVEILSAAELDRLVDTDQHDRAAWGALALDHGFGVGLARYARDAKDARAAEVAVTVVDGFQRRGLATLLLLLLAGTAREAGIERFTGTIGAGNAAALALCRSLGASLTAGDGGTQSFKLEVARLARRGRPRDGPPGRPGRRPGRAAAEGSSR
jgi:RimJ/RimL family protein N-acetyltransferase